jgi:putative spermidine/putrescine transport system permease protein
LSKLARVLGRVIVWGTVVGTLVYLWTPLVIDFIMSLEPGSLLRFPTTGVSLRWYAFLFTNPIFLAGMQVSFSLAIISAIMATVLAIPSSMAFVRYNFRGKGFLTTLFTAPLATPAVVIGVALLYFFSMLNFGYSFGNLLIGHLLLTFPYALRTVTATMFGFDTSLEEASMNLGANVLETFQKITLPIISPAIIASFIFAIAVSLDDVGVSFFLVSPQTQTLNIALLGYWRWSLDPTVGAASAFLIIIGVALTVIAERVVGLDRFLF